LFVFYVVALMVHAAFFGVVVHNGVKTISVSFPGGKAMFVAK
jgi:hypothetical protein